MKNGIASAQTLENCDIQITTTEGEEAVITKVNSTDPQNKGQCARALRYEISLSKEFVAFYDTSDQGESLIKIYSARIKKTTAIKSFGKSTIFDFKFLPGGKLAVLYGYPNIFDEQQLLIVDIPGLHKNYKQNISKNSLYFVNLSEHQQGIQLRDVGKNYTLLSVDEDKLLVFSQGSNQIPEYELKISSFLK